MLTRIIAIAALFCAANAGAATFYVAPDGSDAWSGTRAKADKEKNDGPFATLARARDAVRALKANGPLQEKVFVYLRGGTHVLREPFVLTAQDSGAEKFPVLYAAYKNERPVISGGVAVSGWRSGEDGLWTADVSKLLNPAQTIRQIFVNGQRRRRARIPNAGQYKVTGLVDVRAGAPYNTPSSRFQFKPGDLQPTWTNLTDVEVVVLHYWVDVHLRLASVDAAARIAAFSNHSRRIFNEGNGFARYYVENVLEGLDQPGEWYWNKKSGALLYKPMPDEELATAQVVVPLLKELVRVDGEPEKGALAEHLEFRGLTFSHTEADMGNDGSDVQSAVSVNGAFAARGLRHSKIDACLFENLGTYAVELNDGCSGVDISGNEIRQMGGGGIKLNGGGANSPATLHTRQNRVGDNHIHHLGEIFHSAAGILSRNAAENEFIHNHIHDLYYTAISVGWVWGYGPSISRGNKIEFNHLHDVGKRLISDMGGIYMLGVSPGTTVRNNLIHDVDAFSYGGWGIYTDEGSSEILIENNVVYRTKDGSFHQHYGRDNIVRNNIFVFSRERQLARTREEGHTSFTLENNVIYWKEGALLGGGWSNNKFGSDRNLYWKEGGGTFDFAGATLEQWQQRGHDKNSIVADPQFKNIGQDNFELKGSSPAFGLGFKKIDLSKVGPRKERARWKSGD